MPAAARRAVSVCPPSHTATTGAATPDRSVELREDAVIPALTTLKKRREFLAVRGGVRASCSACLIEGKARQGEGEGETRFGFTVTKKLGNAVVRNRIRRRLKAAVAEAVARTEPGFDYVVVARTAAFDQPYAALVADIAGAFDAIRRTARKPKRPAKSGAHVSAKKAGP